MVLLRVLVSRRLSGRFLRWSLNYLFFRESAWRYGLLALPATCRLLQDGDHAGVPRVYRVYTGVYTGVYTLPVTSALWTRGPFRARPIESGFGCPGTSGRPHTTGVEGPPGPHARSADGRLFLDTRITRLHLTSRKPVLFRGLPRKPEKSRKRAEDS